MLAFNAPEAKGDLALQLSFDAVVGFSKLIICRFVGDEKRFIANKTADHQCWS